MSTYQQVIRLAEQQLHTTDVSENTAKLFMFELLNDREMNLYLLKDEEIDPEIEKIYQDGINRLLKNEPLAYVLGYQWFYGRKFKVHQEVFIPRYETEELCGHLLAKIDEFFPEGTVTIADIACGSGAIGITLAAEEPRVQAYATDLSTEAIHAASMNGSDNDVNVTFIQGDLLQPIIDADVKLDILICNPPYIVEDITLDASVVDYEPHMALFGGKDGLDFYRRLLKDAHKVIKEKAIIAFEIGYDQKDALLALAQQYFPGKKAEVIQDLNGKDRMFFLYHNV